MNEEKKIIQIMNSRLPSGDLRKTKCFESDAEVVEIDGRQFLFTMDEFSGEDMFRDGNPGVLGWNVAVGAIMDILATGGLPLFYGHSMVVGENWNEDYVKSFSDGVAKVLKQTGTIFIGGDTGKSKNWRYTATVIGKIANKVLLRKGAKAGELIYISGKIGIGNLEASIKLYAENSKLRKLVKTISNRFTLPIKHSKLVNKYATSCIDTSDGVFNALNTISELNGTGYSITDIPYIKSGRLAAKILNLPEILLFLGECGEYELLFTIKKEDEEKFLKEAGEMHLDFFRLGELSVEERRIVTLDKKGIDFTSLNVSARDFPDVKIYLKALRQWLEKYFI